MSCLHCSTANPLFMEMVIPWKDTWKPVVVRSGCNSRTPYTGWPTQHTCFSHSSAGQEVQDQEACRSGVWGEPALECGGRSSCCILTWQRQRARASTPVSPQQDTNPTDEGSTLTNKVPPTGSASCYDHREGGISTYGCRGHTNTPSQATLTQLEAAHTCE